MQSIILIIVILTLLRGVSILKKTLMLGSIEKQVEKQKKSLENLKTTTKGQFIFVFFFGLVYGSALISISLYFLFKSF